MSIYFIFFHIYLYNIINAISSAEFLSSLRNSLSDFTKTEFCLTLSLELNIAAGVYVARSRLRVCVGSVGVIGGGYTYMADCSEGRLKWSLVRLA